MGILKSGLGKGKQGRLVSAEVLRWYGETSCPTSLSFCFRFQFQGEVPDRPDLGYELIPWLGEGKVPDYKSTRLHPMGAKDTILLGSKAESSAVTTQQGSSDGGDGGTYKSMKTWDRLTGTLWTLSVYMCVCSLSRVWLCDPMDCSLPGSSVHGILQAKILKWFAISSTRGCSWPGVQTMSSALAGRFFTTEPPAKSMNLNSNTAKAQKSVQSLKQIGSFRIKLPPRKMTVNGFKIICKILCVCAFF